MKKMYLASIVAGTFLVSLNAMDRIVVKPENVRTGDVVQLGQQQWLCSYAYLPQRPQVQDFVVVWKLVDSGRQPVWAQVIAVNKQLATRGKDPVVSRVVCQNQQAGQFDPVRIIALEVLYALVKKGV